MWEAFAMQKLLTFFQQKIKKNINVFAIFQDRNFTVTLANNFVKFEQLGPVFFGWNKKQRLSGAMIYIYIYIYQWTEKV